MSKLLRLLTALIVVAGTLAAFAPGASALDTDAAESQFVDSINGARAAKGLPALAVYGELVGVARNWAQQMANAGDISHNPNLANSVSANWKKLGENVGTGGDVAAIAAAFIASPHHYENIVDPSFNYIGVGVVYARNAIWVAEEFMQLAGAPVTTAPRTSAPRTTAPPATAAPARPRAVAPSAPSAPVTAPPPPPPPTTPTTAQAAPGAAPVRLGFVLEALRALDGVSS